MTISLISSVMNAVCCKEHLKSVISQFKLITTTNQSQVKYHKEQMQTQNKNQQTDEKKEQLKQGENASDKSAAGLGSASD